MDFSDAKRLASQHGCEVRIISKDGHGNSLTGAQRFGKVNVYLEQGRVVGVHVG